jgi:hypothetical protein
MARVGRPFATSDQANTVSARLRRRADVAEWAARHGYAEVRADGKMYSTSKEFRLDRFREHDVEIVIGVDVGGTFTDLVVDDGAGLLKIMGWFNPTMAEVVEMLYLQETPVILDDSKLRGRLGEVHKTPYDRGIQQTLEWMRTTPPEAH